VILEACTQLDSLWSTMAAESFGVTREALDIRDYFQYYGKKMARKWVVLWGDEPAQIYPFGPWQTDRPYKPENFQVLPWWRAYSKLKHNRLENRELATLEPAVNAVAGLFLAILNCEHCKEAVANAKWLSAKMDRPEAWLGDDGPSTWDQWIAAETPLFSHAVGWDTKVVKPEMGWGGPASARFKTWFVEHMKAQAQGEGVGV
jgi:hypothetical protein